VKFGWREFSRLRGSLLAAVLMLMAGVTVALASRDRIVSARAAFFAARAERNDIGAKLKQARGEEHEIRQKAALFKALEARGVVGEEQRLEWVELLGEIRDRRRLIEVRYEFAPPRALDGDKVPAGSFGLYASAMKLQVRLLHEEDLLRLLDELREQARALVQVKRCDVARLTNVNDAMRGELQADCLIDWITLRGGGGKRSDPEFLRP
jgi:hypothetical protein